MRAAAAQMPTQSLDDFVLARLRRAVQQCSHCHQNAVAAVAALCSLLRQEGIPYQRTNRILRQTLNGHDRMVFHRPKWCVAGLHGAAVNDDGAGAAISGAATKARALEIKVIAQQVEQWRIGIGAHLTQRAVDFNFYSLV